MFDGTFDADSLWRIGKILLLYLPVLFGVAMLLFLATIFATGSPEIKKLTEPRSVVFFVAAYLAYKWVFWGYGWVGDLYDGNLFSLFGGRLSEWAFESFHNVVMIALVIATMALPSKLTNEADGTPAKSGARLTFALGIMAGLGYSAYLWWTRGELLMRSVSA